MLVFGRKPCEEIVVDHRIRVKVLECATGHCKIGVECPRDLDVHRGEVERKRAEQGKPAEQGITLLERLERAAIAFGEADAALDEQTDETPSAEQIAACNRHADANKALTAICVALANHRRLQADKEAEKRR